MAIFISYSHSDKDFVDKLATNLVANRINVFVDRWEMNVGDSITSKIQDAIADASYLIVVLSKTSVESQWFKREYTTGSMMELDRKRIVVLPVLLEDCTIPVFLKDKLYADFRTNFDFGFEEILKTVAHLDTEVSGRIEENQYHYSDFASSWGKRGDYYELNIDIVDFSIEPGKPYTILTNITFTGNKEATKRYDQHVKTGKAWMMKNIILLLCAEDKSISGANAHLLHDKVFTDVITIFDPKANMLIQGYVTIKRLGITDGKDKMYYYGRIFERMLEDARDELRNKI